ncbi:hypothetical protein C2869_01890 [Saccharobesus litoralis]|uniref:Solute-binding protein family 3/N-terminal domain-containing protein n=1 Tax=Saccharobesus litoralis TaxID=2172099 RepID=A0A2S0VM32_9ALTE|nr:hypothetical protein C2869_01890 [Saccharobesus litoralis]
MLLVVILCCFRQAIAEQHKVVIAANPYHQQEYDSLLDGRSCFDVNDYQTPYAHRATIELLLICKALHLGGLNAELSFWHTPNYTRALLETKKGSVAMSSETVWFTDLQQDELVYVSDAVIEAQEFEKGFYIQQSRLAEVEQVLQTAQQQGKSLLSALTQFSVISSRRWWLDWKTLNQLGFATIHSSKIDNMCNMMAKKRGDILFVELVMNGSQGLPYSCNKINLMPIQGVKVRIPQSRHYIVSKKYPNSQAIYTALQTGLRAIRASGEMSKLLYPVEENRVKVRAWSSLTP